MLRSLIMAAIRAYQCVIRPVLPASCRFYPSCSEYALQSVARLGPGRGMLRAAGRLARCHPWNPGGYDPVTPEGAGGGSARKEWGTTMRTGS